MSSPLPDTTDPLATLIDLDARKREIEAELDQIKESRAAIERRLLDEWADRGQTSASLRGCTAYVRADFYCNKKTGHSQEDLCSVLEAVGLADMVAPAYSAARLKAWVKERLEDGPDQVPEELAMRLSYDTIPRIVVIKAS